MSMTAISGVLRVGSALPDPPFELVDGGTTTGFDVELMRAICVELGLEWRPIRYAGDDFNGIFDGLDDGSWDCVASGTTITRQRCLRAAFCAPYFESGQSLACNIERSPQVRSIDDLRGMILAVQHGNTSAPVAQRLLQEGRVAEVRTYAYDDIATMLDDLEAGKIGAVMKLAPVMHWMARDRSRLRVVQEGITNEALGIAAAPSNDTLRGAIDAAQARIAQSGKLAELVETWLRP